MLRKSWRYIAVLLALGLLASLTVVGALAAQPGNGKANAKGPKNKGKIVHVNGTVQGPVSATSITVVPKTRGKSGKSTQAVTFVVNEDTKIVGYGIQEGAQVSLSPQLAPENARVNVVGRTPAAGGNPVARIVVILGPEDEDNGGQ